MHQLPNLTKISLKLLRNLFFFAFSFALVGLYFLAFRVNVVNAAVAYDATSESHTGTSGSTNETSFQWTHTPTGTPKGVVVFVMTYGTSTDLISSVTYGGTTMTRVSGGGAADTAGEPGQTDTFFLGSSVPTGAQTVVVNRSNTADEMYAVAMSVTAVGDTSVYTSGIVLLQEDQAVSEQSVNDGSNGYDSLRVAGFYSGYRDVPAAGANSTIANDIDFGNAVASTVYETTPGQGSRSVGFTQPSDDVAAVHLAITEKTITVSGNIYQSGSEVTQDTTAYNVYLSVNNTNPSTVGSTTTASAGSYSKAVPTSAGMTLAVYIYNDTNDANTFTVMNGSSAITGLNLYVGKVAVGNNNSSSTTNANICSQSSYPTASTPDDKLLSCSGSNITTESGVEFHVLTGSGNSYAASGATLTTTGSADLHVDDNATANINTATNTIGGNINVDTGASLTIDGSTTVTGGNMTIAGTLTTTSSTAVVTLSATGNISGGGSITFPDLAIATGVTTTIASSMTVNGGAMTSTGTGAYTYSGTPTVTINGTGNLGGGGTTTLYNLTIGGTTTDASALVVDKNLTVNASSALGLGTNDLTVGSNSVSSSGNIAATGDITQSSSGSTTIKGYNGGPTITLSSNSYLGNLNIGPASADNTTYTVTLGSNIDVNGNLTINAAGASNTHTLSAATTYQINVAGNWTNSDQFQAYSGTVVMDATSGTPTITSGGSAFNNFSVDNAGTLLTWTLQDALDVNGNLLIDTSNTLDSGTNFNLNVAGNFTVNGTYTANSNTTTFDGAGGTTQAIGGSSNVTFSTLSITSSSTRSVTFKAGNTYTISTDVTLTGGGGASDCRGLLIIGSDSPGSTFQITNNDSTPTVSYVAFSDTVVTTNLFSSGTGITDSGNNTGITFDGICTGSSSSSLATAWSFQRKTVLDETNSVYWLFYYDGSQIVSKYSSDGTTWTASNSITAYSTNDFSVWYQNIDSNDYIFVAITDVTNYDIIVKRGTLTSTSITWDAGSPIALSGSSASDAYSHAYISADNSGNLWVMGMHAYLGSYNMEMDKSTKDGSTNATTGVPTWTNLAFNATKILSNAGTTSNVYGNIVPLGPSDNMYASFVIDTALQGCMWDNSAGSWYDSSSNICQTGQTQYYANAASADNMADITTAGAKKASTTLGASTQTFTLDGTNTTFYVLTDVTNKKYTSDISPTTNTTGEKRNLDMAVDSSGNQYSVWEDDRNSQNSGTFTVTGTMTYKRGLSVSTLLPNGKILITGGNSTSTPGNSISEIYDPSSNTFSIAGTMTYGRYGNTANLLTNGKVLIAGSNTGPGNSINELYDPSENTFTIAGTMTYGRTYFTSTLLPNGKVLLVGGNGSVNELYDPSSNTFTLAGTMNYSRTNGTTATLLYNGKVFIAGGSATSGTSINELYDPSTNAYTIAGTSIYPRAYFTSTLLPNGKVLLAGAGVGFTNGASVSELYDPATNTYTLTGTMAYGRSKQTSVLFPNGKVLLVGSDGSSGSSIGELYDPVASTFTLAGTMTYERNTSSSSLLPNGKVIIFGSSTDPGSSLSEIYTPKTYDIYAQKVNSSGAEQWTAGGVKVNSDDGARSTASGNPSLFDHLTPKIKLDSSNNAIVTWSQGTTNVYGPDIYAQKLNSSTGAKEWPSTSTNTYSDAGTMTYARYNNNEVLLPNGKIFLIGSSTLTGGISINEIFDPSANTYTLAGTMSYGRRYFSSTLLSSGNVLISGSFNGDGNSISELYDPATNTYTIAGTMTYGRRYFTSTLLPNGKVFLAGSSTTEGKSINELYDPSANTFTLAGTGAYTRYSFTSTLLPNGKVLLAGSGTTNGDTINETYDPLTNSYANAGTMTYARTNYTATLLPNGKVLLAGSSSSSGNSISELYDPATNTYTIAGTMTYGRDYFTSTLLPNGKVLLSGSNSSSGMSINELYDPATNTYTIAGTMTYGRDYFTSTLLPNGKVLLVGSSTGSGTSISETYTPAMDIAVSNDGSAGNWMGYDYTYHIGQKGLVGAQTNPTLAVDSSDNAVIGWEDGRYNAIVQNRVSFDYGASPTTPPFFSRNLAAIGIGNGGGSNTNSNGAVQAILGPPKKIMGQKLSSATGAKNWGNALASENQNNPQDITLSSTGDTNSNPSLEANGTDIIAAWDSNAATKAENGQLKRESNIYSQKFDGTASSIKAIWGHSFTTITGTMSYGRNLHSATLLPNGKVLIVGGSSGSAHSISEIYDPAVNTYTITGTMTYARQEQTATLLPSGKVLVVGGGYSNNPGLSISELYNPLTGTFTISGTGVYKRYESTATLLPNGKVLVVGSDYNSQNQGSSIAELYDPSTNTFTLAGTTQTMRAKNTATLLSNGKVLIVGSSIGASSINELFDPSTNTFTLAGTMNYGRATNTATLLPNGKVFLVGTSFGNSGTSISEIYDPSTNTYTLAGTMTYRRTANTSTLLPNGFVLLAGSSSGSGSSYAEIYDPLTNTYTTFGLMAYYRYNHTATLLPNGKVLMVGSTDPNSYSTSELFSIDQMVNTGADLADQTHPDVKVSGSNLYYAWQGMRGSDSDGSTNSNTNRGSLTWQIFGQKTDNPSSGNLTNSWPSGTADTSSLAGTMTYLRKYQTSTLLPSGKVFIAGSDSGSGTSISELYDPSSNTYTLAGTMAYARDFHTSTLLPSGKVLLAGSASAYPGFSINELFDPSSNTYTLAGTMTYGRQDYTATLLPNGKVLLAGTTLLSGPGFSISELYDPSSNTYTLAGTMTYGRDYHSSILLPSGKVLLVGSSNGSGSSINEIYNPSSNTYTLAGTMTYRRAGSTSTLLSSGKVLIAGSSNGSGSSISEIFDPSTNTYTIAGTMTYFGRDYQSSTLLPDGKVLFIGSAVFSDPAYSINEIYDPSSKTFSSVGTMAYGRIGQTSTLLPNGKILIIGSTATNDGQSISELYNPAGEVLLSHDMAISADKANPRIALISSNPVVAWADRRPVPGNFTSGTTPALSSDWNIYMQKFDGTTGAPLWPAAATTGGYTSPYAVTDIRVDTTDGTGTGFGGKQYSGKPAIGYASTLSQVFVGFEDNRYVSGASSGECGYSNADSLVRICAQSYDVTQQSQLQNVTWYAYFKTSAATSADISVNVAAAESDGYLDAAKSTSQTYTDGTDGTGLIAKNFASGDATHPAPSDTVGNMSFRRYKMTLTRVGGSVTISYDNTGDETGLGIGVPGTADSIDTVPTGMTQTLSSVADTTNYNVDLLYTDAEATNQISFKKWTNSTMTWDSSPAGIATASTLAYPSLSFESGNDDLNAFWINTSPGYIYYKRCDMSASAANCSNSDDWETANLWKSTNNSYVTSGYRGNCNTFAAYLLTTSTVLWDKVSAIGGAGLTITQDDFKWYETANSVTLTNPWPPGNGDNLSENQELLQIPATNDPLAANDKIRVQMNFQVGGCGTSIASGTQRFQLQYATSSAGLACSSLSGWRAVGGKSDTIEDWRLFDEAAIGDSTVQVNDITTSSSGAEGYYSEINFTATNPNTISSGQNSEWDWPVEDYKAQENTTYCFRMVKHDGGTTATAFDTYNADSYPRLTTAPGNSPLMRHGEFFQNNTLKGLFWAN